MQGSPTWVEIDLDTLVKNIQVIREKTEAGVTMMLTVKADAYGHGAVQVARAAEGVVDRFGVATVDEALEMQRAGITKKILILSPILGAEIPIVVDNGFAMTVPSIEVAKSTGAYGRRHGVTTEVHVEVDTGMGRTGVFAGEAEALIKEITSITGLKLGGVFTHFPVSDTDPDFTRTQIAEFNDLLGRLAISGLEVPVTHSANSAAVATIPESHLQMLRPGLLAYGLLPAGMSELSPTRPILTWKSRIAQIRNLPSGRSVSYGRTFKTKRLTRMAIIPIGYGHGYPFRLSGRGSMIVAGTLSPILGRVTMDMTMLDVTGVAPEPGVGDEVVVIGRQGNAEISADRIAEWADSISYEVFCGISKRVPRIYRRGGKVEAYKSLLGVIPDPAGS